MRSDRKNHQFADKVLVCLGRDHHLEPIGAGGFPQCHGRVQSELGSPLADDPSGRPDIDDSTIFKMGYLFAVHPEGLAAREHRFTYVGTLEATNIPDEVLEIRHLCELGIVALP
jgi:hypothetical protein